MLFLDDLHLERHFGLVNDLVHIRSESLIGEGGRSRRDASLRLRRDLVLPWSWILVLFCFESLDGVSGPVNHMHTLMVHQICAALDVVAAWPIFLLNDGAIDHYRVIHLRILRVGENDPHEIFVDPDGVYLPLVVGHLQLAHLSLAAVHRLFETLLVTAGFVLPRLVLFGEGHLHADRLRLGLSCLSFEPLDLGVEAAGHSEFLLSV